MGVTATVLCIGPVYIDVNFVNFPCGQGLPVEKEISGSEYEIRPGGSAPNFFRFGSSIGLETILTGCVGDDIFGDAVLSLLSASGRQAVLRRYQGSLTEIGINFIAESGAAVMVTAGSAKNFFREDDILDTIQRYRENVDYIYLGGSFKLPHLLPFFESLTRDSACEDICFILDHGRIPENIGPDTIVQMKSLAGAVDIYLPSRTEFLTLWGAGHLEAAAEAVLHLWDGKDAILAVKDGRAGAMGFADDRRIKVSAYEVEVRSTVGAGDSFNAGFIKSWSSGKDLRASLEFGCAAGAVKVGGSDAPSTAEVLSLKAKAKYIR